MFTRELNKVQSIKEKGYEIKLLNGYKVIRGFKLIEEEEKEKDDFMTRII